MFKEFIETMTKLMGVVFVEIPFTLLCIVFAYIVLYYIINFIYVFWLARINNNCGIISL